MHFTRLFVTLYPNISYVKMTNSTIIQRCSLSHVEQYGKIYAYAFSGEPWKDDWTVDGATTHVREILENKQAFGLEYVKDGQVIGFILGSSMLFHYGRTFEVNDLAVSPTYQRRGIANELMQALMAEMKDRGIIALHLITASEGVLPRFYEKLGFTKETRVMLMGKDL